MNTSTANLPLQGIKILDLTRLLPGPFATQYLADLGAEVIRIESPTPDLARLSPPYINNNGTFDLSLNRNKKSIVINLKDEKGKLIFYQLVKENDVIIEQFRPGVVSKLQIDYESIKLIKPDIIYCSLSGYGQTGPYKSKPAHDINYLSEAGFFHDQLLNHESIPFLVPQVPIADLAGSFSTVIAVLSAIISKNRTGLGQYIDVSMFDSIVSWLNGSLVALGSLNNLPDTSNYMLNGKMPYYRIYETADNPISVGALEPHFWEEFCLKLDLPEYVDKQLQQELHSEMEQKIQAILKSKPSSFWIEELKNVCVAPVKNFSSLAANEQLKNREMFASIQLENDFQLNVIKNPLFNSNVNRNDFTRPPKPGEHSAEILQKLGYDEAEIENLRNQNIIA